MRAPLLTVGALLTILALEGCEGCNDNQVAPKTDEAPAFTNDVGSWLSMAVTPEGKPAIAYYDRKATGILNHISSSTTYRRHPPVPS